ncbi:MAG: toll/interleukin-1 receptor domain-containing protein [bacterium]|nr:toll/interleukin-1 receptor domain-containing protein [bacterium]
MKKRIFISYCHKDETWKDRLVNQLEVLNEHLDVWEDRRIKAGRDWYGDIKKAINTADAAILLISADFLTSPFVREKEVPDLFKRKENEKIAIFPLIVSACPWRQLEWLSPLQARPTDGIPLAGRKKHTVDKILSDFAVEIKTILNETPRREPMDTPVPAGAGPEKISLSKLPHTGPLLLGREQELAVLDKAWQDPHTHVLTLVAWGGVGKTALVNQWLNQMEKDRFRGARRVYGWSFYSQGTSVDRQTSADLFMDETLRWFGDPDPSQGSPWDKGKRLADLVRETGTLLVLDGMEPLQYPPGEGEGRLKDQSLEALLKELARSQPGLCVVTTRVPAADIEFAENTSVKRVNLDHLSAQCGAALLKAHGVKGTDAELAAVSTEFKGHALALNLLGRYLVVVHGGDIRQKDRMPGLTAEEKEGGHARRVMVSYETFLSGRPELNILYLLGLFDRPADTGAVAALRSKPWIKGLTKELQKLSDAQWLYALSHLRDLNLLSGEEREGADVLDCHPLVREHFGERLQTINPKAWKKAHKRLYGYYKNLPEKERPDTLTEMEPLFTAVTHGCMAGRHQETFSKVYVKRILRKNEYYSSQKLGALGANLSAISGFFDIPWSQITSELTEGYRGFILNEAGFYLSALGRLREAAQPMGAALELRIKQEDWKNGAINASNLSELYLTLGEVRLAVEWARKSVELADKSGDAFQKYVRRTTLADALHQVGGSGETTEAATLFREAEEMQKKHTPQCPFLFSPRGYKFCDLLLGHGGQAPGGRYGEVQKRANETIKIAIENKWLLDIALDNLSLGRAHWLQTLEEGVSDFTAPLEYLHRAVDGLREAGVQNYLVRGLLARAAVYRTMGAFSRAREDLEEAREIAERGSMGLHLADYHLEAARLCKEEGGRGKEEETLRHLEIAKKMIHKMGYHRRDPEITELEG